MKAFLFVNKSKVNNVLVVFVYILSIIYQPLMMRADLNIFQVTRQLLYKFTCLKVPHF
jgi:hypothetical protein